MGGGGEGGGGVIEKRTKMNRGSGGPTMCVRSLLKKMLRFSKGSFIVILVFFIDYNGSMIY